MAPFTISVDASKKGITPKSITLFLLLVTMAGCSDDDDNNNFKVDNQQDISSFVEIYNEIPHTNREIHSSYGLKVNQSGVFWPIYSDDIFYLVNPGHNNNPDTSDHRLVWTDLAVDEL